MSSRPHLRQLVAGGIRTPVLEAGPADAAEAVVFVHGNPGSCEDWREMVMRTGGFARAVAVTMPGFGEAEKPDDFDATVIGFSRHLGAQLEALGLRRVHLVVHGTGGLWGLQWAADHAGAFASAVLVDAGVFPDYRWHRLARWWRRPVVGEVVMRLTTRRAFEWSLRHGQPRWLPRALVDRMWRDFDAGTRRTILRLYRSTDVSAWSKRIAVRLRELDRPALVIWGGHNPFLPADLAERQVEAFPHAELATLPDSGHWPFADDPERFCEALEPFLRAQAGSDPS